MATDHGLGLEFRRTNEVRELMPDPTLEPTTDPDDLEEVEVRPRSTRGAVVSVRLTPIEASALSAMATRAGTSVSELTRGILRDAISTQWHVHVWGNQGPVVYHQPTGGEFATIFGERAATHGRVVWWETHDSSTAVP